MTYFAVVYDQRQDARHVYTWRILYSHGDPEAARYRAAQWAFDMASACSMEKQEYKRLHYTVWEAPDGTTIEQAARQHGYIMAGDLIAEHMKAVISILVMVCAGLVYWIRA